MLNPRIRLTEELRRALEEIDACRERIHARPAPTEWALQELEREFMVDAVYHSLRIEGGRLTREETERILYPGCAPAGHGAAHSILEDLGRIS